MQTRREVRCIRLEAIAATGRFVSGAYFFRGRTGRQPGEHNRQSAEFQNGVTHGMWHSFVRCDEAHPKALNQSLTLPMHIRGMTLYAADGSSFSWEIANSAVGGFDATFRAEQSVSGEAYSEGDTHHSLSRDTAVGWLRVEAAVRGFDARQIK